MRAPKEAMSCETAVWRNSLGLCNYCMYVLQQWNSGRKSPQACQRTNFEVWACIVTPCSKVTHVWRWHKTSQASMCRSFCCSHRNLSGKVLSINAWTSWPHSNIQGPSGFLNIGSMSTSSWKSPAISTIFLSLTSSWIQWWRLISHQNPDDWLILIYYYNIIYAPGPATPPLPPTPWDGSHILAPYEIFPLPPPVVWWGCGTVPLPPLWCGGGVVWYVGYVWCVWSVWYGMFGKYGMFGMYGRYGMYGMSGWYCMNGRYGM